MSLTIPKANVDESGAALARRRLWLTAGWLAIAHVVLVFAGAALGHSLQLGDSASKATDALVESSLTRIYLGGYLSFLGFLVFLVVGLLLARLLRGEGEVSGWVSSCIAGSAVTCVAVTVASGFAAGAAALYDGHHGASLVTVTTVNDIRNLAFILTGGLVGLFVLSVAAAGRITGALPRWVSTSGVVLGVLSIAAVPGGRLGLTNVSTMLWFVWFVALGVAALHRNRRRPSRPAGAAAGAA
jgi:hypothetical protein